MSLYFCCFLLLTLHILFILLFQSVLGKMNEIAKHKAAIEDAETQNKVSNLCTHIGAKEIQGIVGLQMFSVHKNPQSPGSH